MVVVKRTEEMGYRPWHRYMLWHFYFTYFWKNMTHWSGPDSTKKMTLRYTRESLDSSVSYIHVNRLRISEVRKQPTDLKHSPTWNNNLLDKFKLTMICFQTDHWLFWHRNSFQFHFSFIDCYWHKYCLVLTYLIHFHIEIYLFPEI